MQLLRGAVILLGFALVPADAEARCSYPIIGFDDGDVEAFPLVTRDRIDVQYHDQCNGDEYTRVYARTGLAGPFQLIRSEPANQGGWRTKAWTGREPDTTYCFRVEVKGADNVIRSSGVRCATTAPEGLYNCATPVITKVFPAWRSVEVTTDDRCPNATHVRVKVADWPSGSSSGTIIEAIDLSPTHTNGARTLIVDDLDPARRYCFQTHAFVNVFNQRASAWRCTMPATSPFVSSTAKTRLTTGVGTIEFAPSTLQGIPFTPWESRVWNFRNEQVQDDECRSVVVRDEQGNFVGRKSGCLGLDVPLTAGENYYVYLVNGVSTTGSPASCRLYVDDVPTTTEKCGWTMTPLAGLTGGDRIQAVHRPPNDLLPHVAHYPAHTPPRTAMVVVPDRGDTGVISERGNFIARGAQATVPANVTAAMVLTGFSPDPGGQAFTPLSQPLRVIVNDAARADSDNDGLGNVLENWLDTCSDASGSTGVVPCADVYDHRDSDGDGISDGWEVIGRKKAPGQSGRDLPLPYWGANPKHKDIFAEIDYAHKHFSYVDFIKHPTAEAMRVATKIWAFDFTNNGARRSSNAADLENPDGQPGIAIHFDNGRWAESVDDWTIYGNWGGWNAFPAEAIPVDTDGDGIDDSFEFENENQNTVWDRMDDIRYGVFRHITTFGWNASTGQADWGLSQDIAIAQNDGVPHPPGYVAELITHEMGHALGFGHASPHLVNNALRPGYDPEPGGGRNCKPLWYSGMSYTYQSQSVTPVHGFADGYSYNQRPMRPRSLVEIGALDHYVPNSHPETRELFLHALADKHRYKVGPEDGSVDWNRNGVFDNEPVTASLSTRPFGNCEQGRVNRTTFSIGLGWEDFEVPASLSSVRSGNMTHLLYTGNDQRVRWVRVSFDESCPTANEGDCVTRYPFSPALDPILSDAAQGADIEIMQDAQNNRFLIMAVVDEDGVIRVRTRELPQDGGPNTGWSAPVTIGTSNAAGSPEIVATPGNGSSRLGMLFYKDEANAVHMRRVSGALGNVDFGRDLRVRARNAFGGAPRPVGLDSLHVPAALYSYSHTLRPNEIEDTGASKYIHLFVPQGRQARVLRMEVDSRNATFDHVDMIFTGGIDEGSKLAPVWVNIEPGDDRSGRLYLYYGRNDVAMLARSYERGMRSDTAYSSQWVTEPYGDIDPGARSGSTLTAAVNDSDAEAKLFIALAEKKNDSGVGRLEVRPRPANIEHFTYHGYNDWLTIKYTLCKQTAEGFGKVPNNSNRIDCRPLPNNEPSPRLPVDAVRATITTQESQSTGGRPNH